MYFLVFQFEDRHNLTLDFNEFHALYAYKRYAIKSVLTKDPVL